MAKKRTSPEKVEKIRILYEAGVAVSRIHAELGVAASHVRRLAVRHSWLRPATYNKFEGRPSFYKKPPKVVKPKIVKVVDYTGMTKRESMFFDIQRLRAAAEDSGREGRNVGAKTVIIDRQYLDDNDFL